MAVALVALFVALGGTSYATVALRLPAGSVGTLQLRNHAVTRSKIGRDSITSALIKPRSLLASDFAAGQIPIGPAGPVGPAGAKGDKGDKGDTGPAGAISQITVRSSSVSVPSPNGVGVVSASCQTNERASGAGTSWSLAAGESGADLTTIYLAPSSDTLGVTSYTARGQNGTGTARMFTVSVLCYPTGR
jgi:hypothetical protein